MINVSNGSEGELRKDTGDTSKIQQSADADGAPPQWPDLPTARGIENPGHRFVINAYLGAPSQFEGRNIVLGAGQPPIAHISGHLVGLRGPLELNAGEEVVFEVLGRVAPMVVRLRGSMSLPTDENVASGILTETEYIPLRAQAGRTVMAQSAEDLAVG